jgi:hypothetical protein
MAMTMFSKAATASFTTFSTTKAQRRGAVAVRAGAFDAELIETAVSAAEMRGGWLEILEMLVHLIRHQLARVSAISSIPNCLIILLKIFMF